MRASPVTRMSSVDPDQRVISGLTCLYYFRLQNVSPISLQLKTLFRSVYLDLLTRKIEKNSNKNIQQKHKHLIISTEIRNYSVDIRIRILFLFILHTAS